MPSVTIREISVRFPFTPYEIQKNYMEKVIECLQSGQNGVLESPTGTGKTLSLLCASLAWLETQQSPDTKHNFLEDSNPEHWGESDDSFELGTTPNKQTIIYASRTHSQLYQAMQELRRSGYENMRACVLGSRDQMCIHEELREQNNAMKTHLCRLKVKSENCNFHKGVQLKKDDSEIWTNRNIVDIEDIVKLGQSHGFCPYYMTAELKPHVDILFMPYNYLLDHKIKRALGVKLANCVVILDEAHNIEKVCEDSASIQIKSTDVALCIENLTVIIGAVTDNTIHKLVDETVYFNKKQLLELKESLIDFGKILDGLDLRTSAAEGYSKDGDFVFEMLKNARVVDENFNEVLKLLDGLVQFTAAVKEGPLQGKSYAFELFFDLLNIIFQSTAPDFKQKIKECFKVQISVEEVKKLFPDAWSPQARSQGPASSKYCRVLNFWCFSPGFGMNMLMKQQVHCVILTSGTLAPLKPLISELELDVRVRTENPHIVTGEQVCVKILKTGPDMQPLNSCYRNRDNPKYQHSLGLVISNLVRIIPHGVLIFFPSYTIMHRCRDHWKKTGVWSGINKTKPIYVEPRDKASFKTAMNDYYSKIRDPDFKGAIFMGVCRGKVSEGLDFTDANGRAVFITGLPYPPLKDPKVILKRGYLDVRNSQNKENLNGSDWYSLEATRAINQAVGRVIRHKDDYGAIILLDSRFSDSRIQNNMSQWLQQHITTMQNFGEITRSLQVFFQNAQEKLPPRIVPAVKMEEFNAGPISDDESLVRIHDRTLSGWDSPFKKQKIKDEVD